MRLDISEEDLKELIVEIATEVFHKLQLQKLSDDEDAAWARETFLATIGDTDDDDMQLMIT